MRMGTRKVLRMRRVPGVWQLGSAAVRQCNTAGIPTTVVDSIGRECELPTQNASPTRRLHT